MKIELVCSCGLLIQTQGAALLVDAPNAVFPPFGHFAQAALETLLTAQPPYDRLCGVCFTHTHPDHFDADAVARLRAARPDVPVLLPDGTDGVWQAGAAFRVEYAAVAHTPVAPALMTAHQVLLVTCGDRTLYITADAAPDTARHREILAGRRVDAAFWNGQYLSHPETRGLLLESARRSFIYHIPVDEADSSGIRRKCVRNMERYGAQLPGVQLLPCGSALEI